MSKLSRALRVVALSALMLGAVLAEDAALNVAAGAAGENGLPKDAALSSAAETQEADKQEAGAEAAAAAVPAAPEGAAPVAAAAATAAAQHGDDDGEEDDGEEDDGGAGDGLYFFVKSKGPMRCHVIDRGAGSVFHVHYDFPAAADGKEVTLELRPLSLQATRRKRLDEKPIKTTKIKKEHGSYGFELKNGGYHSLCAVTDSEHGKNGLRLALDLNTGKRDRLYVKMKKNLNLNEMQISMIQLKNRAMEMLREADYVKELEMDYHKSVLRLNREVLWWPISQVVMLLIMGFVQVRHLKKFFKNKRLV